VKSWEFVNQLVVQRSFTATWSGLFFKIFIAQRVYTGCACINYKIVPVTSLNKYLHYGTSGTE